MKFGKRLAAEAARRYGADAFFAYKLAKRSLEGDVAAGGAPGSGCTGQRRARTGGGGPLTLTSCARLPRPPRADAQGTRFQQLLVSELQKVSAFYSAQAAHLEVRPTRN